MKFLAMMNIEVRTPREWQPQEAVRSRELAFPIRTTGTAEMLIALHCYQKRWRLDPEPMRQRAEQFA
jgi:hypothetical protein